jgi:HD superfamily phosphohydrolase
MHVTTASKAAATQRHILTRQLNTKSRCKCNMQSQQRPGRTGVFAALQWSESGCLHIHFVVLCPVVTSCAGLCHDLGHGPFSHVFEKELLPKLFPGNPQLVKEW